MLDPSENVQWLNSNARDMRHFDLLPRPIRDAFNESLTNCINVEDALIAFHAGASIKYIIQQIHRNQMAAHLELLRAGEVAGQSTSFTLRSSARHQRRVELLQLLRAKRKERGVA